MRRQCIGIHKKTEQEDRVQATMGMSCLHKIRIPEVGLKDFNSPALRHGVLILSLPTWPWCLPSKCPLIAHSDSAISTNHSQLLPFSGAGKRVWPFGKKSDLTFMPKDLKELIILFH